MEKMGSMGIEPMTLRSSLQSHSQYPIPTKDKQIKISLQGFFNFEDGQPKLIFQEISMQHLNQFYIGLNSGRSTLDKQIYNPRVNNNLYIQVKQEKPDFLYAFDLYVPDNKNKNTLLILRRLDVYSLYEQNKKNKKMGSMGIEPMTLRSSVLRSPN
ncbi:hypothetical protein pb186bvf_007717 [Paramecium bursaria]